MSKHKSYADVTELNGMPRFLEALPLAVQHVVAMIVGCVTPAIILAGVTGVSPADQIILIQSALLISGVATLLQLFPLGRFCGSGLPVIMGASFAYIPLLISLGSRFDLPTIFGALFPDWAKTIFGESAVVIATITAVTLNLILPEEEEQEDTLREGEVQADAT